MTNETTRINRVAALLGVKLPIMQAPMTYIARAELAAAVSNAGGLGVIETLSPEGREDLKRVRDLTDCPVGANIALISMRDPAVVDTLVEAGIRIVTTSAGDPALFTERLHDAGITVLHVVGTLRAALKAVDAGVDGLVVEGVEGGGFKNKRGSSSMVITPLVASHTNLPIVTAGGICDGKSMAAAFVLGAEGVQLGTRMLASRESPVHPNFKQAIVDADDTGTILVSVPGMPTMRVIWTERSERVVATNEAGEKLSSVHDLYFGGDMEASLANTGQVAGRIEAVQPVAEIIDGMWKECQRALVEARSRIGTLAELD
jgi:enoyl-[acyl-carrier protein] reductase II